MKTVMADAARVAALAKTSQSSTFTMKVLIIHSTLRARATLNQVGNKEEVRTQDQSELKALVTRRGACSSVVLRCSIHLQLSNRDRRCPVDYSRTSHNVEETIGFTNKVFLNYDYIK
jgi:hypothetical protein